MAGWNPNEATSEGKGKLLKPALNDRRSALSERVQVVSRSIPANVVTIATNELIYSDWFSAFQSEITTLIPLFVNHTDNSGSWDQLADIPDWTEATILAEIGDPSRLPAPTDPLISAAWLFQQFNILNLLLWVKYLSTGDSNRRNAGQTEANYADAVNNTESTWDGLGWGATIPNLFGAQSFEIGRSGPFYFPSLQVTRHKTKHSSATAFKYSGDMYAFARDGVGLGYNSTDGFTEDVFNFLENKSSVGGIVEATDWICEDREIAPADPPPGGTTAFACTTRDYVVAKFNVVDGFEFVA